MHTTPRRLFPCLLSRDPYPRVRVGIALLALLLFGSMFGILGAVLSLPLALAIGTIVQVLWVEQALDAGDDEIEPVVDTGAAD